MARIGFVGPSYTGRSTNINAQRTLNLIPEVDQADGKTVLSLFGRPGLVLFAYLGAPPIRTNGTKTVKGKMYAVMGDKFFEILGNGVFTQKGTLLTSTGAVSMDDNGTQIMLIDGTYGYIYNVNTGVFAQITDPDFPGADVVTFMDGYFIFNKINTGSFMITSLYDGTAIDALDIKTAERDPDNLVNLVNDHGELWLFGEYTTEVYYNSGNADFPFDRKNDVVIEEGLAARWSLAKYDNSLIWLAQSKNGKGYVVRANGYAPQRISTPAIEYQISTYPTIGDAYALSFVYQGHPLYLLTFPTGNATWAYDASTGLWHEWGSYGVGRFRAGSYAFFNGKHYVGDHLDGDIYEMKPEVYDDRGDPIERIRRTQYIHQGANPLFIHRLTVDMETGVGIASGQGSDPQAMLRWSDDGGHTWSNEHWTGIGAMGKYQKQAIWNRLGHTRSGRVFELKVSDPIKTVILGADIELTEGR